jgi:uncharacterized protein (TIGR02594 family)
MMKTPWIAEAEKYKGLKEVPGAGNNPTIVGWLTSLKAWWRDDLTAWCGTFVAHCLSATGYPVPKNWYRALAWLDWGVRIEEPSYGCVVVFNRKGGGHVGFVVGKDATGRIMVLGGNQGDAVNVSPFDTSRVAGYRLPFANTEFIPLPLVLSDSRSSANEA